MGCIADRRQTDTREYAVSPFTLFAGLIVWFEDYLLLLLKTNTYATTYTTQYSELTE